MTIDWNGKLEAVHVDGRVADVRVLHTDERNPTHGYKECEVMGEVIWYLRDGRANITYPWHIRNVKEEAVMETKWGAEITGGKPYGVSDDDEVINGNGIELNAGCWIEDFEPYRLRADHPYYGNAASDELATLRAFKAMALERYPDLEPKSETDEEAAHRIRNEWYDGNLNDVIEVALAAMKWARANPRNTETKEG